MVAHKVVSMLWLWQILGIKDMGHDDKEVYFLNSVLGSLQGSPDIKGLSESDIDWY